MLRLSLALLASAVFVGTSTAQTIRFQTSIGHFDMVLNPTNNDDLAPLVDNMLAHVGLGRYHYSAINRAVDGENNDPSDDFVLQMGGFLGLPGNPDLWASALTSVENFGGVVVDEDGNGLVDFNTSGLTNTRGTVSLALAAGDVNSGTSSFFVNLGDNSFLDAQGFVPFAEIPDMSTIDDIMQLTQLNLNPASAALSDVPLTAGGQIVVLERVFLLEAEKGFSFVGPIARARGEEDPLAEAALSTGGLVTSNVSGSSSAGQSAALSSTTGGASSAPEPASTAAMIAVLVLGGLSRRR